MAKLEGFYLDSMLGCNDLYAYNAYKHLKSRGFINKGSAINKHWTSQILASSSLGIPTLIWLYIQPDDIYEKEKTTREARYDAEYPENKSRKRMLAANPIEGWESFPGEDELELDIGNIINDAIARFHNDFDYLDEIFGKESRKITLEEWKKERERFEPCFVQIEPEWIQTDKRCTHGVRGDDVRNEWLSRLEAVEAAALELQRHIAKENDHD